MTAFAGRLFKLKIEHPVGSGTYIDFGGLTNCTVTITNEEVDITDKFSNGVKELLENAGVQSISVSGELYTKDVIPDALIQDVTVNNEFCMIQVVSDNGDKYMASAQITSLERSGSFNDMEKYSLSFSTSGDVLIVLKYWYAQFVVNDVNVKAIGLADRGVTVTSADDIGYQYNEKPSTLLEAFYNCNTVSGLVLVDELGNTNGTIYGGATTVTDIGTAISFNGTTSDGAVTSALSTLSSFAVSIWVNVTWRDSVYDCIFMQENSSTQVGRFRLFNYGQNDGLIMQFGGVSLNSGGIRPVGQTHIVCQYNHLTGLMQMYFNSILIGSSVISTGLVTLSDNLLIGKTPSFYAVNPNISINGSVDKIRIFNRTLSTQEIASLALELKAQDNVKLWHDESGGNIYSKLTRYNYNDNAQIAGTSSHWYKLNGNVNDSAGTSNGTNNGAILNQDHAAFSNITNQYISLPNATASFSSIECVTKFNGGTSSFYLFNGGLYTNSTKFNRLALGFTNGNFRLIAYHTSGGQLRIDTGISVPVGKIIYIVIQNDGIETSIFLNGVIIYSQTGVLSNSLSLESNSSRIGQWDIGNSSYNGDIYDLKLHSSALTSAQIKANALAIGLYDGPITTEYTGVTSDLKPAAYNPIDVTIDTTSTIVTNPDANNWQPYGA